MRALRTVIADGGSVERSRLLAVLEAAGFDVVGEAVSWDQIHDLVSSRAADLVVVTGPPDFARGIPTLGGRVASVILAPDAASAKEYADCGAFIVLTPGVEPEVLGIAAHLAASRAADFVAARKEADQLREQLETRKVVERAKGVLMKRLSVSEDEAYRRMQRASQDENRKMKDIAESILSAERLYGPDDSPPER